jgi:hypothetical protein
VRRCVAVAARRLHQQLWVCGCRVHAEPARGGPAFFWEARCAAWPIAEVKAPELGQLAEVLGAFTRALRDADLEKCEEYLRRHLGR